MLTLLALLLAAQDPLQLGRQALAAGKLEEAEANLLAALAASPPRVFEVHYALGRLYLQKRDYVRAREAFDACLARAPRFAPALVGRARAALFEGDLEAGLGDLKAAAVLPDAPAEAQLLDKDVELYVSRTVSPGAIEDLSSARAYLRAGVSFLSRGETEAAVRSFLVAAAIDDLNPIAFLLLKERGELPPPPYPELPADFLRARAPLDSAAAEAILERRPLFVPARLLLLDTALREKRSVDALVQYDKLLRELPPLFEIEAPAARLALEAEANELAECHAARALERKPQDPALVVLLAEAQLRAGKADAAIATCERAILSGIAPAPVYFTLGNALHGKMEIGASIAALRKAVEMDPQAAEDIASFALSSLTTEDYESLRSLLEAHVETHRDSVNTLYSLGVMSLREGELEKARGYLERVRELAPKNAQAYYNLALVHQRSGNGELAREAMARFQEIKAEEEALWQEGHRRSNLRLRAERAGLEEKLAILTELVKIQTEETPGDFVLLGEGLLLAGRLEEARDAFEKGRTQTARNLAALEGLSRAEAALGHTRKSSDYAEAAAMLKGRCP